ncbi:sialate O-acetylesterase [Kineococcus terrestris]|uniref:sialate O-acetylesterase n=1 Tax=Kineococcus terrestris TaxID=2044856 RepID=UPI0034DACA2E
MARISSPNHPVAGSDSRDLGYDLILLMGQSNMQGADGSIDPLVDVPDPRVWAYPSSGPAAGRIVQASDPLGHLNPSQSGVGPGMSFARWYAGTIPGNRRVLLVPCASSSTGFTAGNGPARWDPLLPDRGNNLYERTITQTRDALQAAGSNARIVCALWAQGEADGGLTSTAYRTYLESLIDGLRDRLERPELPFVIGSMLPEYAAVADNIHSVHRDTVTRKPYTAFVQGTEGYLLDDGLGVHYTAEGQREQGRRMVTALMAARANVSPIAEVPSNPPPPLPAAGFDLSSWYGAETLSVQDGVLRVPTTSAYGVHAAPIVDLTQVSVTWRVIGNQAATSADTVIGVTLDPSNGNNMIGVHIDYSSNPWTQAWVVAAGARTNYNGANRALGWYRVATDAAQVVISYSADGATYTELHRQAAPFALTAVRPVISTGHWDGAEPDGVLSIDSLTIA